MMMMMMILSRKPVEVE